MSENAAMEVDTRRRRRRSTTTVKQRLRQMGNQLSLLNRHVGGHVRLKDVDLDCLDLISQRGPLSPSALAHQAGLHRATVTGVLDRLEDGGWVTRERHPDATDRRTVAVRALRQRNAELLQLYAGMSTAMDRICADYSDAELELIADFVARVTEAAEHAATDLSDR